MTDIPIVVDVDSRSVVKGTAALKGLETEMGKVDGAMKSAGAGATRTGYQFHSMGKQFSAADAAAAKAAAEARRLKNELGATGQAAIKAAAGMKALGAGLVSAQGHMRTGIGFANQLRGALVGMAGAGVVKNLTGYAMQMQRVNMTLTSVTGSAEQAAVEFDYIRKTADKFGQTANDIALSYSRFLAAASASHMELGQTRTMFEGLTAAATAFGLSSYELEGALNAVQQMISKGTVQSEELKGQLGERLPGAFAIAAESMGMTAQELSKALDNGAVSAERLVAAMGPELLRRFGGVAQGSGSAQSKIAELDNAINDLKTRIIEGGFMDALTQVLQKLTAFAQTETAVKQAELLGAAFKILADNADLALIAMGGFALKMAGLPGPIAAVTVAVGALVTKLIELGAAEGNLDSAIAKAGGTDPGLWGKIKLIAGNSLQHLAGFTGLYSAQELEGARNKFIRDSLNIPPTTGTGGTSSPVGGRSILMPHVNKTWGDPAAWDARIEQLRIEREAALSEEVARTSGIAWTDINMANRDARDGEVAPPVGYNPGTIAGGGGGGGGSSNQFLEDQARLTQEVADAQAQLNAARSGGQSGYEAMTTAMQQEAELADLIKQAKEDGVTLTDAETQALLRQIQARDELNKKTEEVLATKQAIVDFGNAVGESFISAGGEIGAAFADAATGVTDLGTAMRETFVDLGREVLQELGKIITKLLIMKALGWAGYGSGTDTSLGTALSGMMGGMASGGVISGPGVMLGGGHGATKVGENGPEAIVPLSRGSDGKLGVGGGGLNVTVINNTPAGVEVNQDGQNIEIVINEAVKQVGVMLARGGNKLASTVEQTYGLQRRRG